MEPLQQAELIRIFIGEKVHYKGKPLFEAIVAKARKNGMAGVTVLRGVMGSGAHSHLHTAKVLRLSEDLPIVIEIVDSPDKTADFLQVLDDMIEEGVVTTEQVNARFYRKGN